MHRDSESRGPVETEAGMAVMLSEAEGSWRSRDWLRQGRVYRQRGPGPYSRRLVSGALSSSLGGVKPPQSVASYSSPRKRIRCRLPGRPRSCWGHSVRWYLHFTEGCDNPLGKLKAPATSGPAALLPASFQRNSHPVSKESSQRVSFVLLYQQHSLGLQH